jgi:RNA polymerase sigma factor (sigma-70 family)
MIITGCLNKDPRSQKVLYERYYGYALKIVFRYIYRYERAVDVVNNGYLKFFHSIERFVCNDPDSLEKMLMGWIRKIMVNAAIDELRRNNLTPEIGGIPEYVWDGPSHEESAEQRIFYKELIILIKELPPSYGAVFNMHIIDGYSHQEISHLLGISIGTSKSNLFKAKSHLQKKLNKELNSIEIQETGTCKI